MIKKTVLVVEDDGVIARSIKARLETRDEFGVDIVTTGYDALRSIGAAVPDALVLDSTLPDVSGSEVCRVVRSRERTANLPVIMLGEPRGAIRPVDGLGLGADDYVLKPFDLDELEARLKAVLRRHVHHPHPGPDRYQGAHLDANFTDVSILVDRRPVHLTKREFLLLRQLVHQCNQVVDRSSLVASVWGSTARDHRIVDSALCKLRTKLGEAGRQIETVAGFGYRFTEPPG